jgi:hypothetical protein
MRSLAPLLAVLFCGLTASLEAQSALVPARTDSLSRRPGGACPAADSVLGLQPPGHKRGTVRLRYNAVANVTDISSTVSMSSSTPLWADVVYRGKEMPIDPMLDLMVLMPRKDVEAGHAAGDSLVVWVDDTLPVNFGQPVLPTITGDPPPQSLPEAVGVRLLLPQFQALAAGHRLIARFGRAKVKAPDEAIRNLAALFTVLVCTLPPPVGN